MPACTRLTSMPTLPFWLATARDIASWKSDLLESLKKTLHGFNERIEGEPCP